MSFAKILVALDNSPLSTSVFNQALDLARAQGCSLMLFHCISNEAIGEPVMAIPVELGLAPELIEDACNLQQQRLDKLRQQAHNWLEQYCQQTTDQGVPTEFDYKVGDPGELICQEAQIWGADAIMLGRRGRSGLAEALLGSVSNYVLHNASCSVLVIQHPEAQHLPSTPNIDHPPIS